MNVISKTYAASLGTSALADYNGKGALWHVEHNGKMLLDRMRLPALDASRQLLAAGETGKARHVSWG
jgi:hypothetical protein